MQKDFFYVVLVGFAGGIFFRSFFDFGKSFSLFVIFLGLVVFSFYFFKFKYRQNFPEVLLKDSLQKIFTIGIFLLFFGFGMLRFDFADSNFYFYDDLVGTRISTEGIIVEEPEMRENYSRLLVVFSGLDTENEKNDDKVIITTNHYPQFNYGDKIKITGVLKKPENFKTDENREFDYISYLAKDNIYYQMFYPETELISSGNGNFVKEKMFQLKKTFLFQIKKIIPEPQSSLLGGLVVGAKESLGKDLEEKFRKVGLIHIVVLSGYNISIVSQFIMNTFSFLPRIFTLSFGVTGIILFAIMTGASATIVRASIMALLVVLANATGRVNQITRSLFLAGFFMLLHNPKILVFDPSFQLSFMATFGLIFLSPKLENHFHFLPTKFQLRESMIATVSTQIFVLPLILYMMGDLSLVAVPVNLLVLTFIPITMLFGFLSGMAGFVSSLLAVPFAYITYAFLSYELKVVDIFSSFSFASVHISYFPFWMMLVVYGSYFVLFMPSPKNSCAKNSKISSETKQKI
ncbi:ComEC family competence protein [Candidatus Parcubacteria bacterium]|nr:ComEC family competence protein [Candidatus Parcubacteria bacterium]